MADTYFNNRRSFQKPRKKTKQPRTLVLLLFHSSSSHTHRRRRSINLYTICNNRGQKDYSTIRSTVLQTIDVCAMKYLIHSLLLLGTASPVAAFVVPQSNQPLPTSAVVDRTTTPVVSILQKDGRKVSSLQMSTTDDTTSSSSTNSADFDLLGLPARPGRPLKVAIAGGGVGGLTAALYMLKKGFDVTVYEKTSAFARFGGPIQFASNALSVLKEIDDRLFDRVMEKFTFTGVRTCGIKDGLRADGSFRMTDDSLDYLWNPEAPADWFVKFPLKECADLFGLRK